MTGLTEVTGEGCEGCGHWGSKGEKIGADEQAGLSKVVQEVITDLKEHSFSSVP